MPDYLKGVYDWKEQEAPQQDWYAGVYSWRDDYDERKKKEEEQQARIRAELEAQAPPPPEPRDPLASLNQQSTEQAYAGARDLLSPHPEAHFPEQQEEPGYGPELGPDFPSDKGPVDDLAQDLQQSWQQQMQQLDQFQQRAQEQQMMAPPISVEVEGPPPRRVGMDQVDHGPVPEDASRFGLGSNLQLPETVPEGRISHEAPPAPPAPPLAPPPEPPGLLKRMAGSMARLQAGKRAGYVSIENPETGKIEEIPDYIEKEFRDLGQLGIGLTWDAAQLAQFAADFPTRLINVAATGGGPGGNPMQARAAIEALLDEEPTNPLAAFLKEAKDGLDDVMPPQDASEAVFRMGGMMAGIVLEYGTIGGWLSKTFGLRKKAEVVKSASTIGKLVTDRTWRGRLQRVVTYSGEMLSGGGRRTAANVAAYGPLDVAQVTTGDAALPHLLDMADEQGWDVPGRPVLDYLNKSPGGRALFEVMLGAALDVPLEGMAHGSAARAEGRAFSESSTGAQDLSRILGVNMRDVEPRTSTELVNTKVAPEVMATDTYRAHPATKRAEEVLDEGLENFPHIDRQKALNYLADGDKTGREKVTVGDVEDLMSQLSIDRVYYARTGKYGESSASNQLLRDDVPGLEDGQFSLWDRVTNTERVSTEHGRDVVAVRNKFEAEQAAKARKAATRQEHLARGTEALKRAGSRFNELSAGSVNTMRSFSPDWETVFDPAIKRDVAIWGGTLIAQAKGALKRSEFDATLRARFPSITDNALASAFEDSTKEYERFLDELMKRRTDEYINTSKEVIDANAPFETPSGRVVENLNDPDTFGSFAEDLLEEGVRLGGHKWYGGKLNGQTTTQWLTEQLGSPEDARMYIAMYAITSTGEAAGGGNITAANKAFAKWKAGETWAVKRGTRRGKPWFSAHQSVHRRSVEGGLARIVEAYRLTGDPGQGIQTPKIRNFFEALAGDDRTVIDIWMMRAFGYDHWNPVGKLTKKGDYSVQTPSPNVKPAGKAKRVTPESDDYEFMAALVDRMAWETREGGRLEHLGKLVGRQLENREVQAAIWVGAQTLREGLPADEGLPVVALLAGKLNDIAAHTRSSDLQRQMLNEFGTVQPSKTYLKGKARDGNELARFLLASESGSANIGAVVYLANSTAGALAGMGVGDTWEERLTNALKLGVGGALGTRIAHGWLKALKDTKGLKESIAFMFKDPHPPVESATLRAFTKTPFARGAGTGAVVGAAVGASEGGDLRSAGMGALAGAGLAGGGAQLLAHTKIGRRLGWDSRGAIGDLSSFKDLPHEARSSFMEKLVSSGPLRQDWLGEIELRNMDLEVDELTALRDLGAEALRDMPRMGRVVGTGARKRIQAGIEVANRYIGELSDSPMTSEMLRTLDPNKVGDISPAYRHPDFDAPFEGGSHFTARSKAQDATGLGLWKLDKVGRDGFVVKVEGQKDLFLTRDEVTTLLRERGALPKKRKGQEGFATGEILRALRDVLGGAAVGGALGGSMESDNRGVAAGLGALAGAAVGTGSVKGRMLRQQAMSHAAKQANSPLLSKALEDMVKAEHVTVKAYKNKRALKAWVAAQKDAVMNASGTAAWVPGKDRVAVLSDAAARELGYNQKDLIANIISEPDVQHTMRYNKKAAGEALQEVRAALQLEGGYAKQAEASGLPEATLRYMDRLERQADELQIHERQLAREALSSKLAQTRIAEGKNPKTTMKGTGIKPRQSFMRFLGDIQKFNISTQSAERRLADTFEAHRKATKMRKTVQHDTAVRKEAEKIARDMGLDPSSPDMDLVPGTTKEQMLAMKDIVAKNSEDLDKIAKYMDDNVLTADEESLLSAHATALTKQIGDMLDRFARTRSEYGRNLRSLQLVANRIFDPSNRSTWYLLAKERAPNGMLTEEMRTTIDAFIAAGDQKGMIDYIARMKAGSPARNAIKIWKAMLLTSPKTHLRNIFGNMAMATLEEMKDVPAYGADLLTVHIARGLGYNAQYTKAMKNLRMVSKAGRDGAVDGMKEAVKAMKGHDPDMTMKQIREKLDIISDTHIDNTYIEGAVNLAFRTLSAEDKFFRGIAGSRSLLEQAATLARNEGKAAGKNTAWMRKRTQRLMAKPSDEMLLRAVEDAEWAVFQNSNQIARLVNKAKRLPGIGVGVEYLMPFVNTPMNIFSRIVDYSPVGGAVAAKRAVELMRKAQVTGALDPKLQKEMVDRFGRATVGTVAMTTGYILYKQDKMRVSYPDTPKEREKWKVTGEQDGSILIGGKWRNIRNVSPVGNMLLVGGAFAQLDENPDVTTGLQRLEGAVGAGIEQFREMPMLTGLNTFSRAIDNWDYESGRLSRNMARSMVPAIIRDLSRAVDSTVRQTRGGGPIVAAQSGIPGASRNLPPQTDIFGRELERDQGAVGSFVDLFSSRKDKRDSKDPVVRAVLDLDVGIGPRSRIEGETDWQYYRRTKAMGEDLYRRIQAEIQTDGFKALTEEKQSEHLRRRIGSWRGTQTKQWKAAHPDYP